MISVEANETAVACLGLLNMFCENRVGDLTIGTETCGNCPLCNDGYCLKIKQLVYVNQ